MKKAATLLILIFFACSGDAAANGPGWVPKTGQYTMTFYGESYIMDPDADPATFLIAAFGPGGDSDCRGITSFMAFHQIWVFYLPITGDVEGEEISFKIWYPTTETVGTVNLTKSFQANTFQGFTIVEETFGVDSVYPSMGELGRDLAVTVTGYDLNENTMVSLYLDTGNRRTIITEVDTPGIASDVAVDGNGVIYVADDAGLQIIDNVIKTIPEVGGVLELVDAPPQMIIGEIETPGSATGITVTGNKAYVADGEGGLQIIDVANPANPRILGTANFEGFANDVAVLEDKAYIACGSDTGWSGLRIIDISSSEHPRVIGSAATSTRVQAVAVAGEHAYLAGPYIDLQIADIRNSETPEIVGFAEFPTMVMSVAVRGNHVYVAGLSRLFVLDVSDPENPGQIGWSETWGAMNNDIAIADNRVYISGFSNGLQIVDISSPAYPQFVGQVATTGNTLGLAVSGENVYLADALAGLQIVDVSHPELPQFLGMTEHSGLAKKITVSGDYAYIASYDEGLQVFDISDLKNLRLAGQAAESVSPEDIVISEGKAYLAEWRNGLHIIDIGNPENPIIMGSATTPGTAKGVAVAGNTAYIADGQAGLQVLDISNPRAPGIIGSKALPGSAQGVAVSGNYAYVACGDDDLWRGVQVLDIRNSENPQIVGTLETPGDAWRIAISGDILVLADAYGLHTITISDPSHPEILDSFYVHFRGTDVTLVENLAYLTDYKGVWVIDITDPENIFPIASMDTPGAAGGVAVSADRIYIADFTRIVILPTPIIVRNTEITTDAPGNGPITMTASVPSPAMPGNYTLGAFNDKGNYNEYLGAITFSEAVSRSKAIILAGGGMGNNRLWEATQVCADYAYSALLYQGYTRENICYLTPAPDFEINSQMNNVDGAATHENLRNAITGWTNDPQSPADTLLLYLIDHGGRGTFRLNAEEFITVQELDQWLDDLQETMPGRVIFVYEACQSGTFLCDSYEGDICPAPLMEAPSGKERIVITSASDEPALAMPSGRLPGGLSFSFQFWANIHYSAELKEAFFFAKDMMRDFQTALMDSDGDGVGNEYEDRKGAKDVFIGRGYQPASDVPVIQDISDEQTLNGEVSAKLWAQVMSGVSGVKRVWAVITPPGKISASLDTPVFELPETELKDSDRDGIYEGMYEGFAQKGTYHIAIYATDYKDAHAPSARTTVIQSLGMIAPGDINADGTIDLTDAITALNILTGTPIRSAKIKRSDFSQEQRSAKIKRSDFSQGQRSAKIKRSDFSQRQRSAKIKRSDFSQINRSDPDITPPELTSLTITPDTVDVGAGPKQMVFTATAQDNLSGVEKVVIWLNQDMPDGYSFVGLYDNWDETEWHDGMASESYIFSEYTIPRTYSVQEITVQDKAGNEQIYDSEELATMGCPTTFSIQNSGTADTTPPMLTSLTITPTRADVADGPKDIMFTASAEDDLSGVDNVVIWFTQYLPNGYSLMGLWDNWEETEWDDGIASDSISIPGQFQETEYHIEKIIIEDKLCNEQIYFADALADMGLPTSFTIVNSGTADTTPPVLKSLGIIPASADISEGPKDITFTATAEDDLSGVDNMIIWFDLDLPSGFSFAGLYDWEETEQASRTYTFSESDSIGEYHIEEITIEDMAQNERTYSPDDLAAMGVPVKFTVTSEGGEEPVPQPPVANAGSDQTVPENTQVMLDGSNSSDPDNDIHSYFWKQKDGPSVELSDPTAPQPAFTAPKVGSLGETLIFELTVTDEAGLNDSDIVRIYVALTAGEIPGISGDISTDGKIGIEEVIFILREIADH